MANHGLIALGAHLDQAVALAREVENLAHQYLLALHTGEEPVLLSDEQMAEVMAAIGNYGPAPGGA
jgi:L-fuculose-phosphate aldolase